MEKFEKKVVRMPHEQITLFEERKNILLSLQEDPFNQIMQNKKKYEYRTRFPRSKTKAYVYVSKTIKKIVAIIEMGEPIYGTSKEIASFASKYDNGNYEEFIKWLNERSCFACPIEKVSRIEPIDILDIKEHMGNFTVPQSYIILDNNPKLLNYLNNNTNIISRNFKDI